MLTDRYGLLVSTTSSAARDAYVEGCEAKLTMYPGAIEAFDRAIAADPSFALYLISAQRLVIQPPELASRPRPPLDRGRTSSIPAFPGSLRTRYTQWAAAREGNRCGLLSVALGARRASA